MKAAASFRKEQLVRDSGGVCGGLREAPTAIAIWFFIFPMYGRKMARLPFTDALRVLEIYVQR